MYELLRQGRILLCSLFVLLYSAELIPQSEMDLYYSNGPLLQMPSYLVTEVQSFDDFINRFNGKNNAYGYLIDTTSLDYRSIRKNSSKWSRYRAKVIGSLFSSSFIQTNKDLAIEFINDVVKKGYYIDFYEDGIYAQIDFETKSRRSSSEGTMTLAMDCNKDRRCRWYIDDIEYFCYDVGASNFKNIQKLKPLVDSNIYIPPTAHNSGFVSFKSIFINRDEELSYHIRRGKTEFDLFNYLVGINRSSVNLSTFPRFYIFIGDKWKVLLNRNWKIISIYENI